MSDEFGPLARAEAEVFGMHALPLTAIPHPLAGNEAELVRRKAAAIAMAVVAALTDAPEALAARHAGRFLAPTERRLSGGVVCMDEACAFDPAIGRQSPDREETA